MCKPMKTTWRPTCGNPITQLVEYKIGNLRVTSSSPALGTSRNGPPIHPVVKWVPGIWTWLASWLFNQCLLWQWYSAPQGVEMVQECTGPVRG